MFTFHHVATSCVRVIMCNTPLGVTGYVLFDDTHILNYSLNSGKSLHAGQNSSTHAVLSYLTNIYKPNKCIHQRSLIQTVGTTATLEG